MKFKRTIADDKFADPLFLTHSSELRNNVQLGITVRPIALVIVHTWTLTIGLTNLYFTPAEN